MVGIGASAGGLEALEQFLRHVPANSGMAYVVIQHLDPTHKGAMVELLQRTSAMPVVQVKDRQKVRPDTVYVIPPNKDMSIVRGTLHLLPQRSPRGLNLPIDFFFRSLAEDRQERGIAVILSGMGSDGTLGMRAIKEKAGAGFVQSLGSAKFDSMPRSAIDAGLADVVASADELPARILAYNRHAPYTSPTEARLEERQQSALEKVFALLRVQTGNDFSLYKKSTVHRRVERRMGLHQIDKIANYVRYLRENPQETQLLLKELLIGVTSFFRDPQAWEQLRERTLPDLFRARPSAGVLRAWVPGCSTGEEVYSLAMVFKEALDRLGPAPGISLQIFATDLDRDAIERARLGNYPVNIAADVTPQRLRRFFVQDERGFRVGKEIRESVVFAPQNIIMDPPFTKLDILSCRNLLIYLSPELQRKLIPLFHYSLNPGGILFLGSAETVGGFSSLFAPMNGKNRIYRRLEAVTPPVEFPSTFAMPGPYLAGEEGGAEPPRAFRANLQTLADRLVVQRYSPTALLTTDKGDVLYTSGRTGKYLEPAVGKASLNVFAMAREGLRYDLTRAFASAQREERPVTVRALKVRTNGETQAVDLTVEKVADPKELQGTMMIVIADAPAPAAPALEPRGKTPRSASLQLAALEQEVQQAREEVQTTREQMQTSQEELKSTNEELQSTNEELQSTNEELTTSKEEMQSMNEELQTVNHELQNKVDELSRSNNDMKNLLNSTDIATLFLDHQLLVRRFTTPTYKLIKLIASDAGRPITDIATELDYPELVEDAREVLRTLVFKEKQVGSRDGRWFTVRIMPYRTMDDVIEGVVVTFNDITDSKTLETTLREQASQTRQMAESLPTLVWACRPEGACDYLSQQWVRYTGVPEAEQLGYGWLEQVHPEERERVRDEWKTAVKAGSPFQAQLRLRGRDGVYRWFKAQATPITNEQGAIVRWYGTQTDVDDLKRADEARSAASQGLTRMLDWISDAWLVLDDQLAVTSFNAAAEPVLGRPRDGLLGKRLPELMPEAVRPAFAEKLAQAVRERRSLSFAAPHPDGQARYEVSVNPQEGGLSVLLRRARGPEVSGGDGGDA
ncbi:MAG TPA: chemotaxis protein CheB [Anaeromyxobacteraceae bacterium]|nr:chemotaxis protein CheB [Anaeromyxobacteraceae bacterium]